MIDVKAVAAFADVSRDDSTWCGKDQIMRSLRCGKIITTRYGRRNDDRMIVRVTRDGVIEWLFVFGY